MTTKSHDSIPIVNRTAWWIVPLLVVAAAYATSLSFGFVADAVFLIDENAQLDGWHHLWANITGDYFYSSSGNTIPYWRPFTKVSWLIEKQFFGGWAGGFHLVSVAWLLMGVAGVMALARMLGASNLWSAMAGLLFGLHPAVIEPVCLIMARSDVVSASCVVLALFAWIRWRSGGGWRWGVIHGVFVVIGLASKESAVILAPLLTLWHFIAPKEPLEEASERDGASGWIERIRWLGPVWFLVLAMLGFRVMVLTGYSSPETGIDLTRIFTSGARYLEALFPFQFETGLRNISYVEASETWWRTALVLAVLLGVLALLWRRGLRAHLMLLVWIGGSLAPVLLVEQMNVPNLDGKIPLTDRWLLQGVAASAVFWALLGQRITIPWARWALVGGICVWSLGSVVVSSVTHGYYASEENLVELEDERYFSIPEGYRSVEDTCRYQEREVERLQAKGETEEVLSRLKEMEEDCPGSTSRAVQVLIALFKEGRFAEVRSLGQRLVKHLESAEKKDTRLLPQVYMYYSYALMQTGASKEALHYASRARELGLEDCNIYITEAASAKQLGRQAQSAGAMESAFDCQNAGSGKGNPALLIEAAKMWESHGDMEEAERLKQRLKSVTTP